MERSYYRRPYAIKNQLRGLWMPELVLYGIRELAKRCLGAILDIEVDQSGLFLSLARTDPNSRNESDVNIHSYSSHSS